MDLKINSFIVFVSLCATAGFAQDPVQAPKTLYKISAEKQKPSSTEKEPAALPREVKSIHSCEVGKKQAVVTTKNPDGTLSTQTVPVKEIK